MGLCGIVLRRILVALDHLVFPGGNIRPLRKLPFPSPPKVVAQSPVRYVNDLCAAVVDLNPVGLRRPVIGRDAVVARQHFADPNARLVQRPKVHVHLVESRLVVRQRRRRRCENLHLVVVVPAPAAVLRKVVNHNPVQHVALAVAQDDRLVLRADAEVRVPNVGHVPVLPVLPAAEHKIVSVRRNHRAVREPPFQRPLLVVAQCEIAQRDVVARGVPKLNPVHQFVVVVPQPRHRVCHHFVDDHAAIGHGDALPVGLVPFLRVRVSRAEPCNALVFVPDQRPALVAGHDGIFNAVDQVGVRIVKENRLAKAAQLEFRVERKVHARLVFVVAVYDGSAVRRQRNRREKEFDARSVVAQANALQVNLMVRTVPDLDPVRISARLVRNRRFVRGHDLADPKALVSRGQFCRSFHFAAVRPDGPGCPAQFGEG